VPLIQQPIAAQPKPPSGPVVIPPPVTTPTEADRRSGIMDRLRNAMPSLWR
jgi:hypothetical protein